MSCPICSHSKKCQKCNGKGEIREFADGGGMKKVVCPHCKGTAVCPNNN